MFSFFENIINFFETKIAPSLHIFAKFRKDCPKIATPRCGGGLAKLQRCHFFLGYISILYRQTGRPNLCYAIGSFFESLLRLCAIIATSVRHLRYSIDMSSTKEDKHFTQKRPILVLNIGRIVFKNSFHDFSIVLTHCS